METPEAWRQRVRREQQLMARLHLATTRLADADRERIWAMVAAKEAGLSIRQIARATGLSPTLPTRRRTRPLGRTPSKHAWPRRWKFSAGASRGWSSWSMRTTWS
jgi:hypothetical protein